MGLIVDAGEFGSGGKEEHAVVSEVVLAATTTVGQFSSVCTQS
jgi:hypothetical protein